MEPTLQDRRHGAGQPLHLPPARAAAGRRDRVSPARHGDVPIRGRHAPRPASTTSSGSSGCPARRCRSRNGTVFDLLRPERQGCHGLNEPYVNQPPRYGRSRALHVPQGDYFVMGDNRGDSEDSRVWGLAAAPQHHRQGVRDVLAAGPSRLSLGTLRGPASAAGDTVRHAQPPPRRRRSRPGAPPARHDRVAGVRLVAGADEAGRGCLAGPLVAAAVCLDTHPADGRASPPAGRSERFQAAHGRPAASGCTTAVLSCAAQVCVVVVPASEIDRRGSASLEPARAGAGAAGARPVPDVCLTDGFRISGR